jgi:uncharacterized protein (TIGR03089 family)
MSRAFADVLSDQLRRDASRPFVTFYDDDTGERVELSLATYANWVAKTAGLLQDELDVERGGLALVDLPTHWLGAVWLGAAWTIGLAVTDDPGLASEADLVVCGPDGLKTYAEQAARVPVLAASLRPLGGRFVEALPTGVVDYGAVVLAQPDVFVALDPPQADDAGWRDATGTSSQAGLVAAVERSELLSEGSRLLTDVNPVSARGLETLLVPLLRGGGTVWVRHLADARWDALADQERADRRLRA